jgi:hypothetical protein
MKHSDSDSVGILSAIAIGNSISRLFILLPAERKTLIRSYRMIDNIQIQENHDYTLSLLLFWKNYLEANIESNLFNVY